MSGKHTVNTVVGGRVADDGVATTESQAVLAVDLVVATVDGVGASPDINVRLAVLPVSGALRAGVLNTTILGQQRKVNNLAVVQLAGSSGDGNRVGVGSGTTSLAVAASAVKSSGGTGL